MKSGSLCYIPERGDIVKLNFSPQQGHSYALDQRLVELFERAISPVAEIMLKIVGVSV